MSGFSNLKKKCIKRFIRSVISHSKAKATMVRPKPMTTCIAGIDAFYSTRFTILLVSQTQHLWTKLDIWFEWKNSTSKGFPAGSKIDTT